MPPEKDTKTTRTTMTTANIAKAAPLTGDTATEESAETIKSTGSWDAEHLLHHDKPDDVPSGAGGLPPGSPSMDKKLSHRFASVRRLHRPGHRKEAPHPLDWGMPGELTQEEVDVYMKFRDEVEKRGGDFRDTIYCFGEEEGEPYALCRWLRARKFKYDDVIKMVEEATVCRATAKQHNFYPDPREALGVDPSVFIAQYPQLYSGSAKNKAPLFISKPGRLNVDAMECITTLQGIVRYHWHVMMIDFANRLREMKQKDPEFVRFECVCVLDLEHLTTAQLSSRALSIVKQQAAIDSLCFPETMSRTIIVNAPRFFSLTWRLIKGWIDPRTASKVEIISSRSNWEKRLRELVDLNQLPSDYGGQGPNTDVTLMLSAPGGMTRQLTELMHLRAHSSYVVELRAGEELDVHVYTKGPTGAVFSILHKDHKKAEPYVKGVDVVHTGDVSDEDAPPTVVKITRKRIAGPAHLKIKADSKGGRLSTENFLVVCSIYPK